MRDRAAITERLRLVARLWAEGLTVQQIAAKVNRSESTVQRALHRPCVLAELNRIREREMSGALTLLATRARAAILRLEEDGIGTGRDSMVSLLANKAIVEPIIRLASATTLAAGKSAAEVGADVRAAEIRRFLAASEEMEAGGDPPASPALPGPAAGPADGG